MELYLVPVLVLAGVGVSSPPLQETIRVLTINKLIEEIYERNVGIILILLLVKTS